MWIRIVLIRSEPDPDPAQNLDPDPDSDPDPGGEGGGVGQPKMCIPPGKILGTPLDESYLFGKVYLEGKRY